MSLLREIQNACTNSQAELPDLLRKCKILAVRLQHVEFQQWVDNELNGYQNNKSLPEYRILKVQSFGTFSGAFGSGLKNAPIPPMCVPEQFRNIVDTWSCGEPISSIQELVKDPSNSSSLISHWPADLIAYTGQNIYEGMSCIGAWRLVSKGAIIGIVDTVRTRILNFALELETEFPDAGESSQNNKTDIQQKVTQIFHTYIAGDVGNLAAGGEQISQQAYIGVIKDDFDSLKENLFKQGIDEKDLANLELALAQDSENNSDSKFGVKTSEWLGHMVSKAAQGVWNIGITTATNVLTQALKSYLGVS